MKAQEITKTIRPRGRDYVYIISWMDQTGERHTEYPETMVEWHARAKELGWKGSVSGRVN
jgi:hypothetical protein